MATRSRARTPWIIAGLIAFVLADLALVGFALRGPAEESSVSAAAPISTFSAAPSASASPGASASAAPTVPPVTAEPSAGPTDSAVPTGSAAPTGSAGPSGAAVSPGASPSAPAAAALSGMASATVGYRATPGTCTGTSTSTDSSTDAVIELTTDGGATWTNVTPTDIRIRAVEKISVVDASHVDVLALYGDDCTRSDVTTYTQGEFWKVYPDRTALFG